MTPSKTPGEKWRDVPGYEGIYKISNRGRVLSVARVNTSYFKRQLKNTIVRPCQTSKKGPVRVQLCKDSKRALVNVDELYRRVWGTHGA